MAPFLSRLHDTANIADAVVVANCAPSGVALSPRLALSPKCGVVVAERAPSGVASSPRLALLPERGVVVTKRAHGVVVKAGAWRCCCRACTKQHGVVTKQ